MKEVKHTPEKYYFEVRMFDVSSHEQLSFHLGMPTAKKAIEWIHGQCDSVGLQKDETAAERDRLKEDLLQETGKCMKYQHEIAKLKEENERLKERIDALLENHGLTKAKIETIALQSINRELVECLRFILSDDLPTILSTKADQKVKELINKNSTL